MRIWSLHPQYLDVKGLVALWRECLLAQKVLLGKTKGYRNHPQLKRFRDLSDPIAGIASYLSFVFEESQKRGYNFNEEKIETPRLDRKIEVTDKQLEYEWNHLKEKLKKRDNKKYSDILLIDKPLPNPLFIVVSGEIERWEIVNY